jgi:drug/metabolite transporter (DMT)-like permease
LSSRRFQWRLYSLIAVMVVFWSLNYIVAKIALRTFPPLLLASLRTTLAALFILPVYLWKRRRQDVPELWGGGEGRSVVLIALFGVALNQVLFVLGLSRTSVAHAALVIAVSPVLVLLLSGWLGHERLSRWKLVGMAIAVAGVAVLNLAPTKAQGVTLWGDALTFLAALTFALFTVTSKQLAARHGALTLTTFAYIGGALMLAPVTLWLSAGFAFSAATTGSWLSLVYMAAFPSVACYLIFSYALAHIPASRVSAFSYLQPLIAGAVAVPVLGEPITSALATGGALVLAGVCITERG